MPDLIASSKRAVEIVVERYTRYNQDLADQGKDTTPHRLRRAAYEQVQQADAASFPAARAAFDQQFGSGEWARQTQLQMRREPGQR